MLREFRYSFELPTTQMRHATQEVIHSVMHGDTPVIPVMQSDTFGSKGIRSFSVEVNQVDSNQVAVTWWDGIPTHLKDIVSTHE